MSHTCVSHDAIFKNSVDHVLAPINYAIVISNFLVSIIILSITRLCYIPGRIFRLFVYNAYGFNLASATIVLIFLLYYEGKDDIHFDRYGNHVFAERDVFNLITGKIACPDFQANGLEGVRAVAL